MENGLPTKKGKEEHPLGTLAVIGLYGLLFAAGWFLIYFFIYVPRGGITP